MKRLLVPLFADKHDKASLSAARAFLGEGAGHVDARLLQRNPAETVPYVGEGVSAIAVEKLLESAKAAEEARYKGANAAFAAWCKHAGITPGEGDGSAVSASFDEIIGQIPHSLTGPGRAADMSVFANVPDQDNADWSLLLETALFETGRPVLLAPAAPPETIGRRVVIAWNGSAEAARAIAVAMPVLKSAEAVFVVSVKDSDIPPDPTKISKTLEINGIEASGAVVPCGDDGVAATLAAEAKKVSADLLLVGAYSHNRLREFVLGGATKDIMTEFSIPVLMTH